MQNQLRFRIGSDPARLAEVRALTRSFLSVCRAMSIDEIVLCVSEACANAMIHSGSADVAVELRLEGCDLVVLVRDCGRRPVLSYPFCGRLPCIDKTHGRGLFLMKRLCDEMSMRSDADGLEVCLVKRRIVPAVLCGQS